jgi:DNA-directed RNA polymerase specialized sigma subunit
MLSCTNCPQRPACNTICPEIEAQLPSPTSGRAWWMESTDAKSRAYILAHNIRTTRAMLDKRHTLNRRQRLVFDMFYNEALTHSEIAATLGVRRNSVSETMIRARHTLLRRKPHSLPDTALDVTSASHDT